MSKNGIRSSYIGLCGTRVTGPLMSNCPSYFVLLTIPIISIIKHRPWAGIAYVLLAPNHADITKTCGKTHKNELKIR